MKINWENLEDLTYLPETGTWRSKKYKYYKYIDACTFCNNPFLARVDIRRSASFHYCSRECQLECPKQRKKQGKSLSGTWEDPKSYKKMILNTNKAREAWSKKRRQEVTLLDKDKKVCSICNENRPINDFTKDSRLLTGLASACKYCQGKQYKKWVTRDGNQLLRNEYMRNKEKSEPKFKLRRRMSTSIYLSIVGDKGGRSWETLVGYTLDDLKRHLEKQFTDGMAWENMGEWHIDHEIPVSVFNFTTPEHEDFTRCWALKNLQPMWAKENMSKSAKLEKHFQPRLALGVAC